MNGYKRFQNLTIDLGDAPARFIALVGPNGCGKSSVFDGMLFQAQAHSSIGSEGRKSNQYHSQRGDVGYKHTNVDITFDTGTFYSVYTNKTADSLEKTIFSFRSPYRYNNELKIKRVEAVRSISDNSYGAASASSIDQKMIENYRRLHASYNSYLEANDARPSEAKNQIIGELNKSIEKCLDIKIDNLGNIEDNRGSLYFTKYDQNEPFEFDVLSSGEKEVVDILLDLYLRQEKYRDTVYLIDEPELHINTGIQRKLLQEIDRLIGPDCQIWVATHSIGLMRAFQTDLKDKCQVIHFEPDTNFASEDIVLRPINKSQATWKKIFSTALDDLSELVSPRQIIYCEGRDSGAAGVENGFDAKVYNEIFGETHPETLFISSGGNTELDQRSEIAIKIISKALSELEILVLKDRDHLSDRDATVEDREVYLELNGDNHRMLMRREIENYLYDIEVLQEYCKQNDLTFDDAGYHQYVTDIQNQNVKDGVGKIKELCSLNKNHGTEKIGLELAAIIDPDMQVFSELSKVIFLSE